MQKIFILLSIAIAASAKSSLKNLMNAGKIMNLQEAPVEPE
jgi:hypothetical protein